MIIAFTIFTGITVYVVYYKYVDCNKYKLPYQANLSMGKVTDLNIKNQTYYFYNDMINTKDFQSNLLTIDKKPYKSFDIYYVCYITIKEIGNCKNIHSVNPLYLIFNSERGYFKEENSEKYVFLDSTEKYEEVFSGILSEIEAINGGEKLSYENDYPIIAVKTDDNVPLNKSIKFLSLTIIIRCIFHNDGKLCPQIYLDECLYGL